MDKPYPQSIMSLDEKLRTGRLSRREFLELATLGMGALALSQCKASSPTTPEPPVPVTLNFEVYNHTQGYRTSFSKTVMSGEQVIIRVGELNVNDVDPLRIAIREDGFGRLVRFSNTGEASFAAPKQSTNYDIILFNKLRPDPSVGEVSYGWMDAQNSSLYKNKRNYTVFRKDFDGQTGPEAAWGGEFLPEVGAYGVFDQLNSALDLGWVKWGYINRQPDASGGDFSYGYANCYGADGCAGGSWIGVNAKKSPTMKGKVAVGLAEGFENICCVDNIGGWPSLVTIQLWGVLNQNGKDLFAYVFAKDSA